MRPMNKYSCSGRIAILLVLLCCVSTLAWAQQTSGSISGVVKDRQGAVVPNAKVILINQAQGTVTRELTSGADGNFAVTPLLPATYTVTVEATGFKKFERKDIRLFANDRISIGDITLEVGALTETITVEAAAVQLQTQSAERSGVITGSQTVNLALNGRNYLDLIKTVPGVVSTFSGQVAGPGGIGNIYSDPCFVYPYDPNDYHLDQNSLCIDAGNGDYYETDIDGEPRVMDVPYKGDDVNDIDMGADEFFWSIADYNKDGTVNFLDYCFFANAWMTEDANISLDDDDDVNMADLGIFNNDWLWKAGWAQSFSFGCTGFGGDGGFEEQSMQSEQAAEESLQYEYEQPVFDIDWMIEQLEDIWQQDEGISELITEEQWQDFLESLKGN